MTVETQSESAVRVNASAADDIVARVLYRDGLMLVIDKAASRVRTERRAVLAACGLTEM